MTEAVAVEFAVVDDKTVTIVVVPAAAVIPAAVVAGWVIVVVAGVFVVGRGGGGVGGGPVCAWVQLGSEAAVTVRLTKNGYAFFNVFVQPVRFQAVRLLTV